MLNSTKVIRYIEKKLGYKFTELEVSHKEILKDIRMYGLKTFSKYFPYIISINLTNDMLIDDKENRFRLTELGDIHILSINRIIAGGNMQYMDPSIMTRPTMSPDIFTDVSSRDMYSMVNNPITFRFYPPDIVEIYPSIVASCNALLYVNAVHPFHFASIPDNMEEIFLEFALLEAKISLYQMRHRFSNLQTPYGNIELFIDDLQEAESKRDDMIEIWKKAAPKQSTRKRMYIY